MRENVGTTVAAVAREGGAPGDALRTLWSQDGAANGRRALRASWDIPEV